MEGIFKGKPHIKKASKDNNQDSLRRISAFDGLRGIAILFVILGHAKDTIQMSSPLINQSSIFWGNSGLGVRLFFVLSGYLITIIISKEVKREGRLNLKWFYIKRVIRIFPSFYIFIFAVFLINIYASWNIEPQEFLSAATFTWNYSAFWNEAPSAEGRWFLGHLWTLSLEEQFYLFWPLAFVLLPDKLLRKTVAAIILCLPFVRVASYFLLPSQRGLLGMMFHTAIDGIMTGCFIALLFQGRKNNRWTEKLGRYIPVLVVIPLFFSPLINVWIDGYSISIGRTIDAVCLGLLVAWLHKTPRSLFGRVLSNSVLTYIGKLSYSLYLWQQLFLTDLNTTISGVFPLNILFCFLVAMISYYTIEMPLLTLKNNMLVRQAAGL